MANIPPVVGNEYVAPFDAQLSISRKVFKIHDGNFAITDKEGQTLFQLKDKLVSLRDKKTLYDGSENVVLSLHKKTLTVHATHEVYAGESNDKIFEVKKAHITDRGGVEAYEVFVVGSEGADYVIKGDFVHRDYSIVYKDEFIVAEIGKKLFNLSSIFGGGKHKYGVKVKSGVDQAFVAAIVVIIDSIHSEEEGSSSDSD